MAGIRRHTTGLALVSRARRNVTIYGKRGQASVSSLDGPGLPNIPPPVTCQELHSEETTARRIVRRESGPVKFVRSIPVWDENGDQLTIYEFQDLRFLRKVRRMKLCTGERVEQIHENTFAIVGTGEKLTRIAEVSDK